MIKKWMVSALLPLFFVSSFLILVAGGYDQSQNKSEDIFFDGSYSNVGLSEAVLRWKSEVELVAKEHDVLDQVPILLAMMMVESGGRYPDLFQASESLGLPVNTLNERESIAQGVKYYSQALSMARENEVDEWSAVQSYNFGLSYISFIANNGKRHTTDLAERYSRSVVAPSLGNTTGVKNVYINAVSIADGRTYQYQNGGNFHYVGLVQQFIITGGVDGFLLPIDPPNISSWFGMRNIGAGPEFHRGLDFAHPQGTAIRAIADGEVIFSGWHDSWGNYVRIEHGNGYCSLYAHNVSNNVKVGDRVKQGEVIALVGSTGRSTGPHLHFEISTSRDLSNASLLDPAEVLGLK